MWSIRVILIKREIRFYMGGYSKIFFEIFDIYSADDFKMFDYIATLCLISVKRLDLGHFFHFLTYYC